MEIKREFVSTSEFDKQWTKMGLSDEDQRNLENEILKNPKIGAVIKNSGGLRKIRFAFENSGKSGGARVLYIDLIVSERVYFITAYPKSQKADISPSERELFRELIEHLKKAEKTIDIKR